MEDLSETIASGLIHYLRDFQARIHKQALSIPDEKFWFRPYPYGNSMGNLISHITGNIEYYIGGQLGKTDYIRNREYEFSRVRLESRHDTLADFDVAIEHFVSILQQQNHSDWSVPYQASGVDDVHNRFDICLRCTMHIHHHLGQMIYLRKAILKEVDP
jgi:uncharacterized damage-inducible protein DinB